MNAEERLQKIAELMQDMEPVSAAAEELRHKIMELLPGLMRPEDADPHTVYRVELGEMKCAGWRRDLVGEYRWSLSTGGCARDDEVTILGRADLPQGAPLELFTIEDYMGAPEGTIVLAYTPNASAWQKFPDGRWYPSLDADGWADNRSMTTFTRRVIRWGRGEHDK